MPMERGQYPELFQISLENQTKLSMMDKLTDMTFDEQVPEYTRVFRVTDGEGTGESDTAVGTFGLPQQSDGEYGGLHYDEIGRYFQQSYVYVTFNLGYQVSHEMMRDEKWGLAGHRARSLGRSFRWLPEVLCARIFNEGFSLATAGAIGNLGRRSPDGKALFATDHPNPGPGGGAQANRPAAGGADLAHASLEAMQIRMAGITTDRGMPIRNPMRRLYVPYQIHPRAKEILNSSFRTDTLNRVKNVFEEIEIICSYYLTNPRAYFGLGDKSMTGLRVINREKPTRDMWTDKETRGVHVGCWSSFDLGFSFWQGTDGDPGLGG